MGIENVKIGWFIRYESGAHSITGLGFKPKVIIFFAVGTGGALQMFCHGWSDGTTHHCLYSRGDSVDMAVTQTSCIFIQLDPSNFADATVTSMDDDGFTLFWVNTPGLTIDVTYLAMK